MKLYLYLLIIGNLFQQTMYWILCKRIKFCVCLHICMLLLYTVVLLSSENGWNQEHLYLPCSMACICFQSDTELRMPVGFLNLILHSGASVQLGISLVSHCTISSQKSWISLAKVFFFLFFVSISFILINLLLNYLCTYLHVVESFHWAFWSRKN